MSLTPENVTQSIDRILNLLHMRPEEVQGYARTIMEACGWMQPLHFEEVCKELVKQVSQGRKPVPKQYIAVYNTLAEKNHWRKKDHTKCPNCVGGFLSGKYRHKDTQQIIDAVRPCTLCQPNANQDLKPELEPVVDHESYMLKTAREMSPKGARWVLSMVEAKKVTYPDDVILALMDNAAKGEPEPQMVDKKPVFATVVENLRVDSEWELAE